jgi:hypothetical protein
MKSAAISTFSGAIFLAGWALATASAAGAGTAVAQVYSTDPAPRAPALISTAERPTPESISPPVVPRGSRPAPQSSSGESGVCPAGSTEEPGYGFVLPSYAGEPYDYG